LQAITSGMIEAQWRLSTRGLNPLDAAMNVVLPEFDGRITTVPMSFKARAEGMSNELIEYDPLPDRVIRIAGIAARFARLGRLNNADKRIAVCIYQLQQQSLTNRQCRSVWMRRLR
jgi:cobaltochelatase CobN